MFAPASADQGAVLATLSTVGALVAAICRVGAGLRTSAGILPSISKARQLWQGQPLRSRARLCCYLTRYFRHAWRRFTMMQGGPTGWFFQRMGRTRSALAGVRRSMGFAFIFAQDGTRQCLTKYLPRVIVSVTSPIRDKRRTGLVTAHHLHHIDTVAGGQLQTSAAPGVSPRSPSPSSGLLPRQHLPLSAQARLSAAR